MKNYLYYIFTMITEVYEGYPFLPLDFKKYWVQDIFSSKLIFAKFRKWWPSQVAFMTLHFLSPCLKLKKSKNSVLQNFANGGHRELAIRTPRFLLPCLSLKKSRNLFLQNFANGGHREVAFMTLYFLSPRLRL